MNKFWKKVLHLGLPISTVMMSGNFTNAMNSESSAEIAKSWSSKEELCMARGNEGKVYKYQSGFDIPDCYLNCVLKYTYRHLLDNDSLQDGVESDNLNKNMQCLQKLENKPLTENLMKVIHVFDKNYVALEYIPGFTYNHKKSLAESERRKLSKTDVKEWLRLIKSKAPLEIKPYGLNLGLNLFIEKWCIGLFNAQKTLKEIAGEFITDAHSDNIIIKDNIPVLIDYCFIVYKSKVEQTFRDMVDVLLDALKTEVEIKPEETEKAKKLREYLESIRFKTLSMENILEVLKELNKIKDV